jgi:phosphoglycolate phosphatase-like HAD superfamily hydrolase
MHASLCLHLMCVSARLGLMTAADLTRSFGPTQRDLDNFARTKYEGALGVIFSLEGVLVDTREVFKVALSILAEDLRQAPPTETQVFDVIGMPFDECLSALQWAVPKESVDAVQGRFSIILAKIMDALPMRSFEGASSLIDSLLRGGDQLVINTYLPRELAIKAISKAGLSDTLEGRMGAERLVFPSKDYIVTRRGQQLLRCCGVMQKPPVTPSHLFISRILCAYGMVRF